MANRTVSGALAIHGRDPQLLMEKIIRERIYESLYWKEECFGLTAELLVDKAVKLTHVGGTFGNQRPTPFLCLLLKMLQLQPDEAIVLELLRNADYKYVRVLAAVYYRMTAPSLSIYKELEPLLTDYRKIRLRTRVGFSLSHIDEIIDDLLHEERVFDCLMPRLVKRSVLEETEGLMRYISPLEDELLNEQEMLSSSDFEEDEDDEANEKPSEMIWQKADRNETVATSTKSSEDLEFEEANALRLKLGLKPLRR